MTNDLDGRIRRVVQGHGRLLESGSPLNDESDLYERGLSSHASVNLMLALEDEFEIEFPEELLTRSTFSSIASIKKALESLGVNDEHY